jgi:hypothetical protein
MLATVFVPILQRLAEVVRGSRAVRLRPPAMPMPGQMPPTYSPRPEMASK